MTAAPIVLIPLSSVRSTSQLNFLNNVGSGNCLHPRDKK